MAVVIIIVRLLAGIIRKSFQLLMLGWVDTIGGILLYMLIYLTVYSVILFFAEKVHMIGSEQIQASKVYSFIEPLGPKILGGIGYIIPVFKGLFTELERFFEAIGDKIPASVQNIYLIKTNSYLA
jgi:membrane protein required for colicin V production